MRGSPVFMTNFIQICSYIFEKILENRQKRPNLGTRPVLWSLKQLPLNTTSFVGRERKINDEMVATWNLKNKYQPQCIVVEFTTNKMLPCLLLSIMPCKNRSDSFNLLKCLDKWAWTDLWAGLRRPDRPLSQDPVACSRHDSSCWHQHHAANIQI